MNPPVGERPRVAARRQEVLTRSDLRARRRGLGLTQRQLGHLLGVASTTIARWERGERSIGSPELVRLALERVETTAAPAVPARAVPVPAVPAPAVPAPSPALPVGDARRAPAHQVRLLPESLPAPLTSLVGRDAEIDAIAQLLVGQPDGPRLVTLTGVGGSGKTRLALAVAQRVGRATMGDIVFVELAPVSEPDLVAGALAHALGVREVPGQPLVGRLAAMLRRRALLLFLDNFERVLGAAPLIAELLQRCPALKVLVTSRAPLRVSGEHEFPVPGLALPAPGQAGSPDELLGVASVLLFCQRAAAVAPRFTLTDDNAAAVAEICVRLDGLPLAIELAAARGSVLAPGELLTKLARPLGVLTGGLRDAPPRHQTLRATIDWSYNLLDEPARVLFRRLVVFAGGATLAAVEAVCDAASGEGGATLDLLSALVDTHLVRREVLAGGESRFSLLDAIHEYALERLQESGEAVAIRRLHATYYLALAAEAEPALRGPQQAAWLRRLEREAANLRAALGWMVARDAHEAGEPGLQLAAALGRFWALRGHVTEGRAWLTRLLALPTAERAASPARPRAKALAVAGDLAWLASDFAAAHALLEEALATGAGDADGWTMASAHLTLGMIARSQGDQARVRALAEDGLRLARAAGDREHVGSLLWLLGSALVAQNECASAQPLLDEALEHFQEVGDTLGVAQVRLHLGELAWRLGDASRARAWLEESLALFQGLDTAGGIAAASHRLGEMACLAGDLDRARALLAESLRLYRQLGEGQHVARSLAALGQLARAEGDPAAAGSLFRQSLTLARPLGLRPAIIAALEGIAGVAGVAAAEGQALEATRLLSAADAARAAAGPARTPADAAAFARAAAAVRAEIGGESFAAAWADGKTLSLDRAAACALALDASPAAAPPPATQPPPASSLREPLTHREREVAALITQGYTNRQIAAALVVTEGTAAIHVGHILRKLECTSRAQVAVWVVAQEVGITTPAITATTPATNRAI